MKNLIFYLLCISLIVACSDDDTQKYIYTKTLKDKTLVFDKSLSEIEVESDLVLVANSNLNTVGNIIFEAEFEDSNGNLVAADEVKIGSYELPFIAEYFQHSLHVQIDSSSNEINLFGDEIEIEVINGVNGSFDTSIYNPELINITSFNQDTLLDFNRLVIDKTKPLTINWVPDPLNEFDLILSLTPFTFLSKASLPTIFNEVPDNGSFTFPASTFSGYESGGNDSLLLDGFTINLIRGNQVLIDHGNDKETVITLFNNSVTLIFIE